ncbi:MAG: peptidylprolyl isomerase [Pirellulaceae bacterium]
MRYVFATGLLMLTASLYGCKGMQEPRDVIAAESGETVAAASTENLTTESGEPAYIKVQHCLIAFAGTGTKATRSKEEAEKLAIELFEKAKAGENFEAMIRKYTDDSPPGIYKMANHGFPANGTLFEEVYARGGMVPAFGNVGFPLQVGEFGLAAFDEQESPYGWHIVKRIE